MSNSPYFDSFDTSEFSHSFPSGPDFLHKYEGMSRDELQAIQENEFKKGNFLSSDFLKLVLELKCFAIFLISGESLFIFS